MTTNLLTKILILFTTLSLTAGCASTGFSQTPPPISKKVVIQVTPEPYSSWTELPAGTYSIPDSQVVISGHQSNSVVQGLMLGPLGMQLANASAGANLVKDYERRLQIKLDKKLQEVAHQEISKQSDASIFQLQATPDASTLIIKPLLVMALVSKEEFRPSIILNVALHDGGRKSWETRYIFASDIQRPMLGANGWLAEDGTLASVVEEGLRQATNVMLTDLSKPFPRDENARISVDLFTPFNSPKMQLVGLKMAETGTTLVFTPLWGTPGIGGVYVLEKRAIRFRPATKDESPLPRVAAP
ncbi:MAG: hypothetical protein QM776_00240 [Rhodocyclaceae bacterium]